MTDAKQKRPEGKKTAESKPPVKHILKSEPLATPRGKSSAAAAAATAAPPPQSKFRTCADCEGEGMVATVYDTLFDKWEKCKCCQGLGAIPL